MDQLLLFVGLGLIAVAIVVMVLLLSRESTEPTGVAATIKSIETVYSGRVVATQDASGHDRFVAPIMRRMRWIAERLSPRGVVGTMQQRLDTAGNPGDWTPERILAYKGLGLVATSAVFSIVGVANGVAHGLVLGVAGAAAGFFLPDLQLHNAGLRRQASVVQTLPDTLDLLSVSVQAGLGFDAALSRVARNTTGPLAGELTRVLQEMQIGKSREEALRGLAKRTSVEELRTFTAALIQASDLGIPIGNVLREQASEMRVKRRQRAEERAQKLPVKITFPVIFCIMPALFIVVIGPAALSLMETFGRH